MANDLFFAFFLFPFALKRTGWAPVGLHDDLVACALEHVLGAPGFVDVIGARDRTVPAFPPGAIVHADEDAAFRGRHQTLPSV